jgi:hypothetical protein
MSKVLTMPETAEERKKIPLATGLIDYFPDALIAVADISYIGNVQHNLEDDTGTVRWDRSKSKDESDAAMRHFFCREDKDSDGRYHAAKACWRMLAFLQKKIETDRAEALSSQYKVAGARVVSATSSSISDEDIPF